MKQRLQKDVHQRGQPIKPYYVQDIPDWEHGRQPINQCWGYNEEKDYNYLIPDMVKRRNEWYEEIARKKSNGTYIRTHNLKNG